MSPHGGGSSGGPMFNGRSFPALGLLPQCKDGRYLVVERTDQAQTLEKLSPFLIDKAIRNCCGDVASIKRIRDGKILVQTKTGKQANQLEKLKTLTEGINVSVTEHNTLNLSRIVISCKDLLYMKDDEILEELRPQKVIKLDRIKRKVDGELVETSSIILTLSISIPPPEIKIGFIVVPTRPYYPRPMRCFQCLAFGHLGKHCKREKTCANCGDKHHGDDCRKTQKCVNCEGAHESISPQCPVWIKETKIVRLRIDQNIPFYEARRLVEQSEPPQEKYADIAAKTAASVNTSNCKCKCTCDKTTHELREKTPEPIATTSIQSSELDLPGKVTQMAESNSSPQAKKTKKFYEDIISSDCSEPNLTSQLSLRAKSGIRITKRGRGRPRKVAQQSRGEEMDDE
ncbi:uncharacterized protein LOC131675916 [Topomyia yanbarensis]|uniref:uncharacterized protein LOC131675916 n=1 Tax=Topomyia yanbarensis TaxID=2498891 RepID=UPI00273A789B|nr:uncharacterized protein LOC131675916 [Topomyia yanbarensis]